MCPKEADIGLEEPDNGSEEPDTGSEEPDNGSEEPDTRSEEPNWGQQEPDWDEDEPFWASGNKPGTRRKKAGALRKMIGTGMLKQLMLLNRVSFHTFPDIFTHGLVNTLLLRDFVMDESDCGLEESYIMCPKGIKYWLRGTRH